MCMYNCLGPGWKPVFKGKFGGIDSLLLFGLACLLRCRPSSFGCCHVRSVISLIDRGGEVRRATLFDDFQIFG